MPHLQLPGRHPPGQQFPVCYIPLCNSRSSHPQPQFRPEPIPTVLCCMQAAGTPSTPTQTPSPGEPSASDPTDTSAQLDTLTLNKTQSHTNGHHAPDASGEQGP